MTSESIEAGWLEAMISGPLAGMVSAPRDSYPFTKRGRIQRAPAEIPPSATAQSSPMPTSAAMRAAFLKMIRIIWFADAVGDMARAFAISLINMSVNVVICPCLSMLAAF